MKISTMPAMSSGAASLPVAVGVRRGSAVESALPSLIDRDRYDGKLYEKYEERLGKTGAFLRESDKDYLGMLYAEAEAKGGNARDADDPKMKRVDKVAKELVKARVLEQLAPADPHERTDAERIAAGEDTRRLSRNYQRAVAVAEEQQKARAHRSSDSAAYVDDQGHLNAAL